jgi:Kef-type K+ transport system membrane component KefB
MMLELSVILATCRLFAEIARKLKQPAVVGEMIAGIILGPTLLGTFFPEIFEFLFPMSGTPKLILEGFTQVAVVLLLFIAGLEVDLHIVWQQGKQALFVSVFSLIIPFVIGFLVCYYSPSFFGVSEEDSLFFSLFMATIMGMTALPVIARILMDLGIFKSRMGMLIVASAMIVDLLCWLIFSVILGMMGKSEHNGNVGQTIGITVGFSILMLTLGRWLWCRAMRCVANRLDSREVVR